MMITKAKVIGKNGGKLVQNKVCFHCQPLLKIKLLDLLKNLDLS